MPRSRRLSDATLVRRSQQGDRRAFTALLTRYDWRLRGLAHALLLDPAEMDAALGVGYLRAWRDVVRISPSDNVAAWLYRVVYNACIDQLRRADGATSPADATPLPAGGVATGLAALPAAERVVVVLVDREGFSPSSAARIMGLSPGSVTATLDRARATLAEHVPPAPPEAGVPEPPPAAPVPAPAADPEPVVVDAEADDSPASGDAAVVDAAPVGDAAPVADPDPVGAAAAVGDAPAVGDVAPVGAALAVGDVAPVGGAAAVGDAAVAGGAPVRADDLAVTSAPDTDEADDAEDADGFEERGPIDHEAVADAVVAEAPAADVSAATSPALGGVQGRAHDSDGASGNGNGATSQNGHNSNSGRGRRARRRAKHAAAQQRPDGTGPAGDGST